MIEAMLSRLLSAPDSPTADLYFRNACGDFLDGPVRQLGPTVFVSDAACLVMRHAMRAGPLPERRRLIYLIDDDVDAGTRDAQLPFLYRQKLRLVEQPAGRHLVPRADIAVVSSEALARVHAGKMRTHVLRPHWSEPFVDLAHFDALDGENPVIDVAYLGSSVHRGDLEFLYPVLACLLTRHPNLRVHVPERHTLPHGFDRHPRVLRIPGVGWTAYREGLRNRRFHIALYPLLDTPFNRARSINKLIEHAVVGAAPVYSAGWAEIAAPPDALSAIRVPNTTHAWAEAVSALIRSPRRGRLIAERSQRLAMALNDPAPQRRLWKDLFDLKEQWVA